MIDGNRKITSHYRSFEEEKTFDFQVSNNFETPSAEAFHNTIYFSQTLESGDEIGLVDHKSVVLNPFV